MQQYIDPDTTEYKIRILHVVCFGNRYNLARNILQFVHFTSSSPNQTNFGTIFCISKAFSKVFLSELLCKVTQKKQSSITQHCKTV